MTITIPGQTIKMDIATGIEPVWYDKLKVLFETVSDLWIGPNGRGTAITASLGADVVLNNTGLYFDGPSIAQGTTGTWWVTGGVTVSDGNGAASFFCKLHDGTTIIDSGFGTTAAATFALRMTFSGFITNPAGNLRISVRDVGSATGKIIFNTTGNSKDSTISAFRIA